MASPSINVVGPQPGTCQVSRAAFERWVCGAIWPALRSLANSNVEDFNALRDAGNPLPGVLKLAWFSLIQKIRQEAVLGLANAAKTGSSPQREFILVLKRLNEAWLLGAELFLARHPICFESEHPFTLWDSARVTVHRVVKRQVIPVEQDKVEVCFLDHLYPQTREGAFAGVHDGVQDYVLISISMLRGEVIAARQAGGACLTDWEQKVIASKEKGFVLASPAYQRYARQVAALYPEPQQHFDAFIRRTIFEEVRHGIDGKRVHRRIHKECSTANYYYRYADLMMSTHGRLRAYWNTLDLEARGWFGRTVSELSGQMTAAASHAQPRLVLLEWLCSLERQADPKEIRCSTQAHDEAAEFAVRMLAEELAMLTPPPRWLAWLQRDLTQLKFLLYPRRLPRLAQKILLESNERLRLALKSIYSREFVLGAIDEFPFCEIRADGSLSTRASIPSVSA